MDKLRTILVICVALGTLSGMVWGGTAYFAKAADLELVAFRLEQKIVSDRVANLQSELWRLQDRYGTQDCMQMPQPSSDRCRVIKAELRKLRARL